MVNDSAQHTCVVKGFAGFSPLLVKEASPATRNQLAQGLLRKYVAIYLLLSVLATGWWRMIKEFVVPPATSPQPHHLTAGQERCTAVETH